MSELFDKQVRFPMCTAIWLAKIYDMGYCVTTGDGYRSPVVFGEIGEQRGYGHRNSNHKRRLAHDWNLFRWEGDIPPIHRGDGTFDYSNAVGNWVYMKKTEDYREVGELWESLHPDNIWGGRFEDGNHMSVGYKGQM